jgi:hypothetical protein
MQCQMSGQVITHVQLHLKIPYDVQVKQKHGTYWLPHENKYPLFNIGIKQR